MSSGQDVLETEVDGLYAVARTVEALSVERLPLVERLTLAVERLTLAVERIAAQGESP